MEVKKKIISRFKFGQQIQQNIPVCVIFLFLSPKLLRRSWARTASEPQGHNIRQYGFFCTFAVSKDGPEGSKVHNSIHSKVLGRQTRWLRLTCEESATRGRNPHLGPSLFLKVSPPMLNAV